MKGQKPWKGRAAYSSRVTGDPLHSWWQRVVASLFLVVLLAACALPHVPSRAIYEDPVNFVRLELDSTVLPEWPPSAHNHPLVISAEEVAGILRGFQVREHRIGVQIKIVGEAPWEPAFREDEIALLAPRLSDALAQAKPDERVAYYLSRPQTSIKREITSGGLYIKDHYLHFILGNRRIIYGIPAYGMVYDRRYPMMPTAAKGFDLVFAPAEAVVEQEGGILDYLLGREKDETVIDLQKLRPVSPVTQSTPEFTPYPVIMKNRETRPSPLIGRGRQKVPAQL